MHRAIFIQCLPALIALMISFAAAVLLIKFSGARFNWGRLRELHRCQDGGVQSLSFVLTLPMFLMFVMFIVQISQLMIGMVTVNYAAFAAARSASVWIPAEVPSSLAAYELQEHQNRFDPRLPMVWSDPAQRLRALPTDSTTTAASIMALQFDSSNLSKKYSKIRTAAILGCAPVAPSRPIQMTSQDMSLSSQRATAATQAVYRAMDPASVENPRINTRIQNKIRYADRNTVVFVEWQDALPRPDTIQGPTYNPVGHPLAAIDFDQYGFKEYEVGWQDPVSVYVVHRFALFPGPGRFLANILVRPLGVPARVRQMVPVEWQATYVAETDNYSVLIPAAATLPAEGIQSRRPYVHDAN